MSKNEELRRRLEESLENGYEKLDLGGLHLAGDEMEFGLLAECTHLKILVFGRIQTLPQKLPPLLEELSMQNGVGSRIKGNTIEFLTELHGLKKLDLRYGHIVDLAPLQCLTNLTYLNLAGNEITDLKILKSLPQLQELYLSGVSVNNYDFLQYLINLVALDLSFHELNELSCLDGVNTLETLILDNNLLSSTAGLESLTSLHTLNLSYNQITNITPLRGLDKLKTLYLNHNQVIDLTPLKGLNQLERLDLGVNQITDVKPLHHLNRLDKLFLNDNQITDFPHHLIDDWSILNYLNTQYNPIQNIPSEIYNNFDNCLPALCTYFSDLAQGKTKVHQSKVILIGNGRTGKTCLVKRWLDETFDVNEASTHAIQLRSQFLPALEQAQKLDYAQLNIWDFGGQDIYHSTHLLFMQTQAVFVLVWDAETEAQATQEETLVDGSTITYQNHPLTYWLDYAKALGAGSPILIVQTKKERDGEQLPKHWDKLKARYNIVGHVSVDSALDDGYKNGFKNLQLELEKTIYAQIEKSCIDLPSSWWEVRQEIAKLQEAGQKTLSQDNYLQICEQFQLGEGSQNTLRNYLHDTGFFFYRPEIFDKKIIIDQQWAIEAVYTLLDRQGMFMKYRGKGFFFGEDLSLVWSKRSLAEQELLVSFMESCEMCVEVSCYWGKLTGGFVPFEKREYLAPQLLPDEPIPNQTDIFPVGAKGIYIKVKHAFLHTGVMQHFIVSYARQAARENIKKNCIYLRYEGQKVLIQALPADNEILVRLATPDNDEVLSSFGEVLQSIRLELTAIGQSSTTGTQEMVSIDGKGYVTWNALRNQPPENPKIRAHNGQYYDFAEFEVFLNREHRPFNHPLKKGYGFASSTPVPNELKAAATQALEHLDCADIGLYFEALKESLIPDEHLFVYNRLKKTFLVKGVNVDYDERLRVFANSLLS